MVAWCCLRGADEPNDGSVYHCYLDWYTDLVAANRHLASAVNVVPSTIYCIYNLRPNGECLFVRSRGEHLALPDAREASAMLREWAYYRATSFSRPVPRTITLERSKPQHEEPV